MISEKANDLLNKFGSAQFDFMVWNTPDNLTARDKARQEISDYIAELEATVEVGADIAKAYENRVSEIVALSNETVGKLNSRIAELEAENLELRKTLGWAYDLDEYKDEPEVQE